MSVNFVLFLCFFFGFDRSYGQVLDQDHQPRQWQDLVTFVNQKIGRMEHLMNIKDERLDQLESKLQGQETEITSLKKLMLQKDNILSNLVKQVTDLRKGEFVNTISDTSIEPLDRAQFIGVASPTSVNSTSDVTDPPVRGDPDTHTAGDGRGEYNTRHQQDAPSDVTIPTYYNRVAPSTSKHTVSFHAYRTSTVTLGTQATVIFDHEDLDHGDGYSPGDGLYTVPESGTYVITWTMFAYDRNAFQNVLVVNGATRGMSWTDAEEVNDAHQSTGIIVMTLKQGDHLFIRMGRVCSGKIFSDITYSRSTFSGWKLD